MECYVRHTRGLARTRPSSINYQTYFLNCDKLIKLGTTIFWILYIVCMRRRYRCRQALLVIWFVVVVIGEWPWSGDSAIAHDPWLSHESKGRTYFAAVPWAAVIVHRAFLCSFVLLIKPFLLFCVGYLGSVLNLYACIGPADTCSSLLHITGKLQPYQCIIDMARRW